MWIEREGVAKSVTVTSGGSLSSAFDMRLFTMMVVTMPGAWTAASIAFKVAAAEGGSYVPLYDEDGYLVEINGPVSGRAYAAPAEVAVGRWVKLWSQDGAGNDVAQAGTRTLTVGLKA